MGNKNNKKRLRGRQLRKLNAKNLAKNLQSSRERVECGVNITMNGSADKESEPTAAEGSSELFPKMSTVTTDLNPCTMATDTATEAIKAEAPQQPSEDVECRACLQRFDFEAGLLDIFQAWEPPWNGMGDNIAQDLAQITNIEITPTDSYSKLICQFCHQKLLEACSFAVNVRINDRILRQRAVVDEEDDHSWPKPIQIDRNVHSDIFNTAMDVEIKQEVLSDEDSYNNCPDNTFKDGADVPEGTENVFNNLEIKIEPEEIMRPAPYQITVNGTITEDQFEQNSIHVNGDHKEPEQARTVIHFNKRRKIDDDQPLANPIAERETLKQELESFLKFNDVSVDIDTEDKVMDLACDKSTRPFNNNDNEHEEEVCDTGSDNYETVNDNIGEQNVPTIYALEQLPKKLSEFRIKRNPKPDMVNPDDSTKIDIPEQNSIVDMFKQIQIIFVSKGNNIIEMPEQNKNIHILKQDNIETPKNAIQYQHTSVIVDRNAYLSNVMSQNTTATYKESEVTNDNAVQSDSNSLALNPLVQVFGSYPPNEMNNDETERYLRPPCFCHRKCFQRITHNERLKIFNNFWKISNTWKQRYEFITNNVRVEYIPTECVDRRKPRFIYYYQLVLDSKVQNVCRIMFLNTLCIGDKFIVMCFTKLGRQLQCPSVVKRVPVMSMPDESLPVNTQMESAPPNPKVVIISNEIIVSADSNASATHSLYREQMPMIDNPPIVTPSRPIGRLSNTKFNLHFRLPIETPCDFCKAYAEIQDTRGAEENEIFKKEKEMHDEFIQEATVSRDQDKIEAEENLLEKRVLLLDVQLDMASQRTCTNAGIELFTLGVTIFDVTINIAAHFVWSHDAGGRGPNEIASCLIRWLDENSRHTPTLTDLTLWSTDNPEHYRNLTLVMAYMWLLHKYSHLKVINHKFTVTGHAIEEVKALHLEIYNIQKHLDGKQLLMTPDLPLLVKTCQGRGLVKISDMRQCHFKDLSYLNRSTGPYVVANGNLSGEEFNVSQCVWLQVRQNRPGMLFYKKKFSDQFSVVAFSREFVEGMPGYLPSVIESYGWHKEYE